MGFYDYFQIGTLLAFVSIVAGRSLLMLARDGRSPFALGAGKRGPGRFAEVLMVPAMGIWLVALIVSAVDSPAALPAPFDDEVIRAEWTGVLGAGLLVGAIALFVLALLSFGSSWRVGIDEQSPGALATGGVFAYSRNPIFVAMDAFFLGVFLAQGTLFFLLAAILCAALTHFQILQEEKFLIRTYGEDYARYRAATPRYVGLRHGPEGVSQVPAEEGR